MRLIDATVQAMSLNDELEVRIVALDDAIGIVKAGGKAE